MNQPTNPTPPVSPAALAAATWWAQQIHRTRPETDGLHPDQTRDQAYTVLAGIGLRARLLQAAPPVTDENATRFVEALAYRITALADRITASLSDGVIRLTVDYAPCRTLAEAADTAGINHQHFPHKTATNVRPDHVLAKAGYGAPFRLIWAAPGWQHPPCSARRWSDKADDYTGDECTQPRWHHSPCDWST